MFDTPTPSTVDQQNTKPLASELEPYCDRCIWKISETGNESLGMRLVSLGMRLVSLGMRLVSLGMRLVSIGMRLVSLGMRLVSIGMRLVSLGMRVINDIEVMLQMEMES